MAKKRIADIQRKLLLLTITQLFDQLRDRFLELFDLNLSDKDTFTSTPLQFGAVVNRFLVLAEIAGINIEKAVWGKYPRKCPYCDRGRCECGDHKRNPHSRLRVRFPKNGLGIGQAQRMLAKIYPARPLQEQILKVVEEIEEAKTEVCSLGRDKDTQDEFADVFARLAALATHIEIRLQDVTS